MTKDQAISVTVRVETAITALRDARKHVPPLDGDRLTEDEYAAVEEIGDSIDEALQAAETAQAALKNIIGV